MLPLVFLRTFWALFFRWREGWSFTSGLRSVLRPRCKPLCVLLLRRTTHLPTVGNSLLFLLAEPSKTESLQIPEIAYRFFGLG